VRRAWNCDFTTIWSARATVPAASANRAVVFLGASDAERALQQLVALGRAPLRADRHGQVMRRAADEALVAPYCFS